MKDVADIFVQSEESDYYNPELPVVTGAADGRRQP